MLVTDTMETSFFISVHLNYTKNFNPSSSFENWTNESTHTTIPWHKVEEILITLLKKHHWKLFDVSFNLFNSTSSIILLSLILKHFLIIFVKVFPDNFMRREVQAFVVNCTFEDEGCNWKGEVRHLEV